MKDELYGFGKALVGDNVRNANGGTFPFTVSIRHTPLGSPNGTIPVHRCTGTFVGVWDILTASHCLEAVYLQEISIAAGSINVIYSAQFYPYWWLTYNEWANFNQVPLQYAVNDIVWIRLTTQTPQNIQATTRNHTNSEMSGKRVQVMGWSYMENGTFRNILQRAKVLVMEKPDCDAALTQLAGTQTISDARIVCSYGDPPVIFENGDNGGPLIFRRNLAGINIATCPGSIGNLRINMHTSLEIYYPWINYMKWCRFCALFFQFLIFYKIYGIGEAMRGLNVKDSLEGNYPYAVSLRYVPVDSIPNTEPQLRCTGTLVTRSDVITAGHCVQGVLIQEIHVCTGSIDMRLSVPNVPFWWIHYNEWANQLQVPLQYPTNDIAWIKLTDVVQPDIHVFLGNHTSDAMGGRKVQVAGWAYKDDGTLRYILQKARIIVMAKVECDQALSYLAGTQIVSDVRVICSYSDPPVIFENGDNGGPLLFRGTLAAINIGTCPGNVGFTRINMHTSLQFYYNFIAHLLTNF